MKDVSDHITASAEEAGWNLLAAMEAVIKRLIGEQRIDFAMLREVEEMRDELEAELLAAARSVRG